MSVATPWPLARRAWARSITRHLAERVLALGDGGHGVLAKLRLHSGGRPDRAEDRVHRPVSGRLAHPLVARRHPHADPGPWLAAGPGLDLEPVQRVGVRALAHLVGDDRLEVQRGDLLLLVGDLLEPRNAWFSALPSTLKPSCSSASRSAWRPECLPSTIEFDSSPTSRASMIS